MQCAEKHANEIDASDCKRCPIARFRFDKAVFVFRPRFLLLASILLAFGSSGARVMAQSQSDFLTPQEKRALIERERTLELLKIESDDAGQRIVAPHDPGLSGFQIDSDLQKVHAQNQQTLSEMRAATTYQVDSDGRPQLVPRYSAAEINQRQQDMDREEQNYFNLRQDEAAFQYKSAQSKANLFKATAANLAEQLTDLKAKQTFRLSPVGTNVYVRNFETIGTEPPEDKPEAPTPARLQPKAQTSDKAIIPPGWNPLEEPGRKLAPKLNQTSKKIPAGHVQPLNRANVKGKAVY